MDAPAINARQNTIASNKSQQHMVPLPHRDDGSKRSEGWAFCYCGTVVSFRWNVGLFLGSSKSGKKEKFQSWKIITLMTFIQGESSPCQSVFIYVCPRTFMVMCHYEVSLVLIRGVFFPPHTTFVRGRQREKKREWKRRTQGGKDWGWDGDGWDERKETGFALQMHILISRLVQLTTQQVHARKCKAYTVNSGIF